VLRILSRIQCQKDFGSRIRIRIQEVKYFEFKKIVSKFSKKWYGLFIPDPDLDFLPIPDTGYRIPGSKRAPDPGSRSATLVFTF
jgi:hypothetical protein